MDIKICDEFYYRITDVNLDMFSVFNTSKDSILRNNNKINFYPGEWVKIKANDYITHIVKPAETINLIAKLYEISADKIIKDNNIDNLKLFIGQRLKIYK